MTNGKDDCVWVVMDVADNRTIKVTKSKTAACHFASQFVGNRVVTDTGEIVLYGPGDGTTEIMVRAIPRAEQERHDRMQRAAADLYHACKAVLEDLHKGDRCWRAGPWADPNTPEGKGGKVEMLRKAVAAVDNPA